MNSGVDFPRVKYDDTSLIEQLSYNLIFITSCENFCRKFNLEFKSCYKFKQNSIYSVEIITVKLLS